MPPGAPTIVRIYRGGGLYINIAYVQGRKPWLTLNYEHGIQLSINSIPTLRPRPASPTNRKSVSSSIICFKKSTGKL